MLASVPEDGSPKKGNSYFTSTTFEGVSRILDSLVAQTCAVAPPGIFFNYFPNQILCFLLLTEDKSMSNLIYNSSLCFYMKYIIIRAHIGITNPCFISWVKRQSFFT